MWLVREGVRWVEKRAVEILGRGGWISRGFVFGVDKGGEEEMWVGGGGDEGGGAGLEDIGAVGRRELLSAGSSLGGEDGICIRGFFETGGKGRVGDGELDRRGRLAHCGLMILGELYDGTCGWESGIVLGGVCHESEWVRRRG